MTWHCHWEQNPPSSSPWSEAPWLKSFPLLQLFSHCAFFFCWYVVKHFGSSDRYCSSSCPVPARLEHSGNPYQHQQHLNNVEDCFYHNENNWRAFSLLSLPWQKFSFGTYSIFNNLPAIFKQSSLFPFNCFHCYTLVIHVSLYNKCTTIV